jgi:hypothetical protein
MAVESRERARGLDRQVRAGGGGWHRPADARSLLASAAGRNPFRQCRLWVDDEDRSWFICEACFQTRIRPESERLAAALVPDALRLLRAQARSDDPQIAVICRDGLARYESTVRGLATDDPTVN